MTTLQTRILAALHFGRFVGLDSLQLRLSDVPRHTLLAEIRELEEVGRIETIPGEMQVRLSDTNVWEPE